MLVKLLLNTGLRPNEAFTLEWKVIDLKNKRLIVLKKHSKTDTARHIPLNKTAMIILKEWKKKSDSKYVFTGKNKNCHLMTVYKI